MTEHDLPEIRCGRCAKLLARGHVLHISIKCPRCKTYNTVRAQSPNTERHERPKG